MQFKVLSALGFATLAAAKIGPFRRWDDAPPVSQCNTGDLYAQAANCPSLATLFGLLGIVFRSVTGQVGVTCSPITVVGAGGNACSAQPVFCSNDTFSKLFFRLDPKLPY
ncbi:hypothetical protein GALMADRAFT_60849 [Galerina marginata CBS 339.88]|uniref:Hydrophobin n=1 Tax=Galerina marginata (strain CBS 339.88) TaxID=685588 RepID=A0A067TMF1_GALM3|nr:hypothetical protein GALMADRAFT_60849 [Galerina marginata CBS 339.88]